MAESATLSNKVLLKQSALETKTQASKHRVREGQHGSDYGSHAYCLPTASRVTQSCTSVSRHLLPMVSHDYSNPSRRTSDGHISGCEHEQVHEPGSSRASRTSKAQQHHITRPHNMLFMPTLAMAVFAVSAVGLRNPGSIFL